MDRTMLSTGSELDAEVESQGGDLNNIFRFGPKAMNQRLTVGTDFVQDTSSTSGFDEEARNLDFYVQHCMTLGDLTLDLEDNQGDTHHR